MHPKTGNHLRSHLLRAIMAVDHRRFIIRSGKKIRPIFLRSTSWLYKILPTNLGACKPTFYIIYTSHLRWNSTMRHCFYHTDLGQQNASSQYCDTNCYSGQSKHAWAFAVNRWKNFQNHLYGQPVLTFTVLAVASVWTNINRVTLQHNKEFIMFIFYFKTV